LIVQGNLGLFEHPVLESLAEGAFLLRNFALPHAPEIVACLDQIIDAAPLRHMSTPGGFQMSVAMTNCGKAGWISDRKGYRYAAHDPTTQQPWPPMPAIFTQLATQAAQHAGFTDFHPDVCLINRYEPGARMTLHQDKDEQDFSAPIVSVSLGLPAVFLFGGMSRKDPARRIPLANGDVVVWGGPSRLTYHGINPLKDGSHPLTGHYRFNLTFRRAL
jgi:alkylated DNA repair protein (DNA oxidative demethylase)